MWQSIKNIYHLVQAIIANIVYGFPSTKLRVIGVTGTDGKTTTTSLIYHILKSSGKKVSMISTIYAEIGGKVYDTGFHVTTPSPFTVQKYLKDAVDNGDEYFILETTSHALDQFRVWGVLYKIGLITNITHEHLLYHGTYENYVRAKTRLIAMSELGIINRDDESYDHIIRLVDPAALKSYGITNPADYQLDISQKIDQKLAEFNKYNYLAAYSVAKQLQLEDEEIFQSMKTFKLPAGRMEVIYEEDFIVILDFAHTPKAIYEALKAVREEFKQNRIIHIFGAASQRDDSKRPLMGEASGEFADLVIITEEDHRQEDPVQIADQIGMGLINKNFAEVLPEKFGTDAKKYTVITDRQKAIEKAIEITKSGDVLIITGKGHEKSLNRYGKEYPWDDKTTVLESIKKREMVGFVVQ